MIRTYVSPPWHAVEPGSILGSPEFGVGPEVLLEWSHVLHAKEGSLVSILYSVFHRAGIVKGSLHARNNHEWEAPKGRVLVFLEAVLQRDSGRLFGTGMVGKSPRGSSHGRSGFKVGYRELQLLVPRVCWVGESRMDVC